MDKVDTCEVDRLASQKRDTDLLNLVRTALDQVLEAHLAAGTRP